MSTRATAPEGAPCWVDLWTSDVEGSRKFYGEVFGWESEEPDPQFGGYFSFLHQGVRVAGAMGDMGDMPANNTWKVYLATSDIERTVADIASHGGQTQFEAMQVGDLGLQTVLTDATGATLGTWQPLNFQGFTVLNEHGTPSWCELHTRAYAESLAFYRNVFQWEVTTVGDTDDFRYATVRDADGGEDVAGIMDARSFLPEGMPDHWSVYWAVDDVDATIATVTSLGGSTEMAAEDTPYGRLATVVDPSGARFKLRGTGA